jgi:hypothetical protein
MKASLTGIKKFCHLISTRATTFSAVLGYCISKNLHAVLYTSRLFEAEDGKCI